MDPTFDAGYFGGIGGPGNSGIQAVALQPDGKVVIAGAFSSVNGYSRLGVARLNTNGVVDPTFFPTCDVRGLVGCCGNEGVTLLPDGRILLNGYDGGVNDVATGLLLMLNPDG